MVKRDLPGRDDRIGCLPVPATISYVFYQWPRLVTVDHRCSCAPPTYFETVMHGGLYLMNATAYVGAKGIELRACASSTALTLSAIKLRLFWRRTRASCLSISLISTMPAELPVSLYATSRLREVMRIERFGDCGRKSESSSGAWLSTLWEDARIVGVVNYHSPLPVRLIIAQLAVHVAQHVRLGIVPAVHLGHFGDSAVPLFEPCPRARVPACTGWFLFR